MRVIGTTLDADRVLPGLLELDLNCLEAFRIPTCFFWSPCCLRLSLEEGCGLFSVRGSIALELADVLFRVVGEDVDDVGGWLQLECLLDLHWQRWGWLLLLLRVTGGCWVRRRRSEVATEEALDLL